MSTINTFKGQSFKARREGLRFLFFTFLSWRIILFIFLYLSLSTVFLQTNFLGGGLSNYLKNPHLWAWVNFDGEHYLSIAYQGYLPLTYFYFPVYPLLTRIIASLVDQSYKNMALTGLLISNISFFLGLVGLYKLILLDFKKEVAYLVVALLLIFPTSFYFGSFYTESLFLALIVWSFYFARNEHFRKNKTVSFTRAKRLFIAGALAAVASATRPIGIILFPVLFIEAFGWEKPGDIVRLPLKDSPLKVCAGLLAAFLVPIGIGIYMFYLWKVTGDPLEFFHSVSIFGQQRSSDLILLPQVFYRYFVKILPNLNYNYFPIVFSTALEIVVALLFLVFSILAFLKLRLSYAVFLLLGYIAPTLSGSFSSLPRYVLVLFPGFILAALYLKKFSAIVKLFVLSLSFIGLAIATAMFVRGYWIA